MALGELEVKESTLSVKELHWKIPGFSSLETDGEPYVGPCFTFLNYDWDVNIDPSDEDSDVFLRLDVDDYVGRSYDMMCRVGILKADGSVAGITICLRTLCSGYIESVGFRIISRDVLLQNKTELMPFDNLTIMFHLQLLYDPMELREVNTLSRNIEDLFAKEEFCDITFDVKDKKFKAHRAIIAARSSVFAEMFKEEALEKETGVITIPDCDPDSFKEFLRYLYSGKVQNISFRCAVHMFKVADKFNVKELICFCMDYIRQHMKVGDFFEIIALAEEYEYDKLHNAVQDFFNNNLGEIFKNDDWHNLLKTDFNLANKLLIEMSSSVEVVRKKARLEI